MTREETHSYLERAETAFLLFVERNPNYPQTEANARLMAAELRAAGLSPDNADHLSAIWQRIKPPTAAPAAAPVAEEDRLTVAARGLIASVGGDEAFKRIFSELSAQELQRRMNDLAFERAVELLFPHKEERTLSRGDVVRAEGQARLHGTGLTAEIVRAVERSNDFHRQGFANYVPPPEKPAIDPHFSNPMARRPEIARRTKLTVEEARANEEANKRRGGRGMRSLSVHERNA